ncbi:MAG: NDP-sugar synthase [Actinobacteria bacterium]|nr:NDP-sugar synthase [Actinomycetota bacterium]MCL6105296.1 NDP-sugar synthase [Actinomycetota bacterium]
MKAVVLVGGEGTRLRPLTLSVPKQMLPIGGIPMIEKVLTHLSSCGVTEATLSLGYKPDAFLKAYPTGICAGIHLYYALEPEPLDTAGAISFAAKEAGITDTFVVVNGDILSSFDISRLVEFHHKQNAKATIHLIPVEDPSAFGVVKLEILSEAGDMIGRKETTGSEPTNHQGQKSVQKSGKVIDFVEKPPKGSAPSNLINAGTYVLEPEVLEHIPLGKRVSIEKEVFPLMANDGTLYALATDDYWIDAGTPATYIKANLDSMSDLAMSDLGRKAQTTQIAKSARVYNSVLGKTVMVNERAEITNSVVLDGVIVGNDSIVDNSIIGFNAVLGAGSKVIKNSVIGCGAFVPPGHHLVAARFAEMNKETK